MKNLILVFSAGLALSACSSFRDGEGAGVYSLPQNSAQAPSAQAIDLMAQGGGVPVHVDPAAAIAHNTDGRVQVFGLGDGGGSSSSFGQPMEPMAGNGTEIVPLRAVPPSGSVSTTVFSGDPSVQIFSLEDDMPEGAPSGVQAPRSGYSGEASVSGAVPEVTVIYFDHDSHALKPESVQVIASVSKAFNPAAGQGIDVEGHASVMANYADEAQREIVNLKISMDRAMAVSRELIRQGVPAEAIRVTAWGATRPPRQLDGKTPEEAARRVEISGQGLM